MKEWNLAYFISQAKVILGSIAFETSMTALDWRVAIVFAENPLKGQAQKDNTRAIRCFRAVAGAPLCSLAGAMPEAGRLQGP